MNPKYLKNEKGVALVITLLVVTVLLALGSIFVLRTINEKYIADKERQSGQAFYAAEGGSQAGIYKLDQLINTYMLATVNATNPQVIVNDAVSYVAANNGLGFLIKYVKNSGVAQLTLSGTQATFNQPTTVLGQGTYQYDIIITQKTNPITVSADIWDFPYYFKVQTTGGAGGPARKVLFSGDFTVRVQRDNFAKYALFTNHQTMEDGTTVWFTSKTNFAGPLHTNDRYNIAFNPSGVFDGAVVQQSSTARFYNNGSPILLNANNNGIKDVPTFNAGFTRNASAITLSSSVQKQDLIDQARGTDSSAGNGIFVANSGGNLTGGIYVNGNSTLSMSVDGSNRAVYNIVQGATNKIITVDRTNNQTLVNTVGVGTQTYNGLPDGVDDVGTIIYANGSITNFSGTVQGDTELTVSSENDIIISNHVRYQNYTPSSGTPGVAGYVPPSASGQTNLLGLVTWSGDVRVGTSAPNNIDIHGTILAQNGVAKVDNYDNQGVGGRGTATLLGGVISDYYGAFGLYNGSTGALIGGFGRNFVYDNRLAVGKSPPYFPSLNTFIAFTNDIVDKKVWQEGGF